MRAFLLAVMAVLAFAQQADAGVFTKAIGFIAKKEVVVVGAGLCLKSQSCRSLAERGAMAAGKEAVEICEEHPKCAALLANAGAEFFNGLVDRIGIQQLIVCSENGSCGNGPDAWTSTTTVPSSEDHGQTILPSDEKPAGGSAGSALPKPVGIPDDWIEQPSDKGGGTEYVNPKNPNDRVRVMPGDPNSPYPHQRKPYVVDQNGSYRDVNGNPIPGPLPKFTTEAHIPLDDFIFRR